MASILPLVFQPGTAHIAFYVALFGAWIAFEVVNLVRQRLVGTPVSSSVYRGPRRLGR